MTPLAPSRIIASAPSASHPQQIDFANRKGVIETKAWGLHCNGVVFKAAAFQRDDRRDHRICGDGPRTSPGRCCSTPRSS